jgi:hypothetical protein
MKVIDGYEHRVSSHCESGSVRNLLAHAGLEVSEPMLFGLGSGPLFYYLFFMKGVTGWPMVAIRNKPGSIAKNVRKLCGVDVRMRTYRSPREAMAAADELIDAGRPVAAVVDLFYMKYIPAFQRQHVPVHFIVLVGHDEQSYTVSDPYFETLATLDRADLAAAWETHAPMATDNLLIDVRSAAGSVDWKKACTRAMLRTCKDMVLPAIIRRLLFFVGVEGMRTFARKIAQWPERYRGSALREGLMYTAIGFEDQGTGGAAFRLMYAAFLREAADLFQSGELRDLGQRILVHGREWRRSSRKLIELARPIPMIDEEYGDWVAAHGSVLREGLCELSQRFLSFAQTEQAFFQDLRKAAKRLR